MYVCVVEPVPVFVEDGEIVVEVVEEVELEVGVPCGAEVIFEEFPP